jgi:hypothetical protein
MSSKKDAGNALAKLRDYLKRDKYGLDLVGSVERFLGDLRKERADAKATVEQLREDVAALRSRADVAVADADRLRADIACRESESVSLRNQAARANNEAIRLREHYEPRELEPSDLPDAARDRFRLFRTARRMVPVLPDRIPLKPLSTKSRMCTTFGLEDLIKGYSYADCAKLGTVVAALVTSGMFSVHITSEKSVPQGARGNEHTFRPLVRWLGKSRLVGNEHEWQDKISDMVCAGPEPGAVTPATPPIAGRALSRGERRECS